MATQKGVRKFNVVFRWNPYCRAPESMARLVAFYQTGETYVLTGVHGVPDGSYRVDRFRMRSTAARERLCRFELHPAESCMVVDEWTLRMRRIVSDINLMLISAPRSYARQLRALRESAESALARGE